MVIHLRYYLQIYIQFRRRRRAARGSLMGSWELLSKVIIPRHQRSPGGDHSGAFITLGETYKKPDNLTRPTHYTILSTIANDQNGHRMSLRECVQPYPLSRAAKLVL